MEPYLIPLLGAVEDCAGEEEDGSRGAQQQRVLRHPEQGQFHLARMHM